MSGTCLIKNGQYNGFLASIPSVYFHRQTCYTTAKIPRYLNRYKGSKISRGKVSRDEVVSEPKSPPAIGLLLYQGYLRRRDFARDKEDNLKAKEDSFWGKRGQVKKRTSAF